MATGESESERSVTEQLVYEFGQMSEEELLILCEEDQVPGACDELDRRGVEPIPLPLGPDPIPLAA